MSKWIDGRSSAFSLGVIDKIDDTELPAGALRSAWNMISKQVGKIKKRNGQAKLNTTELGSPGTGTHYPVQGIHTYYKGTTKYLLVVANGVVYACTPPATTMTVIKTGLDTTAPVKFVNAIIDGINCVMGFNGVNTPFKWDGIGTAQVETATVVGTITTAGDASVVVTAAGMTGSPVTLSVAVALNDTATLITGKIRTAMAANAGIAAWFYIGGTGADVVLTRKSAAANDANMNISVTTGTAVGITDDTSSADTTAGVASSVADMNDYRIVTREEATTTDYTVYTLANKPVRTGTDKFFVFSNNDIVDAANYTLDATNGTVTFMAARVNVISDLDSDDAQTVTYPYNGQIEATHPFKTGCTVSLYDKYKNLLHTFTDEIEADGWRADYAAGYLYTPTSPSVDTVEANETATTTDHLTYTAKHPFKVGVAPVVKDKDGNTLTPSSISYTAGTYTFGSSQAAIEPLKTSYTWVNSGTLVSMMPLLAAYEWVDSIKVDYQYSNGNLSNLFRYPVAHGGRVFCMAADERIYWSDINENGSDYESWPPVNNWPVNRGSGEEDGCLVPLIGDLYVFKTRSIFRFRGGDLESFDLVPVEPDVGCAGPFAACAEGTKIYFVSEQGLYDFNGVSATNLTRDQIPILWSRVNKAALSQAAVWSWDGLVLFALPIDSSTTNNAVLVYDTSNNAFWPWDSIEISCFAEISTTSGMKLYSGHAIEGFVIEQDTGTDDYGTNISAYFELPTFDMGAADYQKKSRYVDVEYGENQVTWGTVKASKDGAAFLELTAKNADGKLRKFALKPTISGKYRYLCIRVEHSTADAFELRSVNGPFKPKSKPTIKGAAT